MKKNIDFLRAHQARYRLSRQKTAGVKRIAAIVVGANLLVAVAIVGYLFYHERELSVEAAALDQYLTNSEQAQEYQRILKYQGDYAALRAYNALVETSSQQVRELPDLTRQYYQALAGDMPSNMKLLGMTFANGLLTATFSLPNSEGVPRYVEKIKNSDAFLQVTYSGWEQEVRSTAEAGGDGTEVIKTSTSYYFVVFCILKEEVTE